MKQKTLVLFVSGLLLHIKHDKLHTLKEDQEMKTKIYYVMDTMCGWCYGFSDVINQVHEKYKNDLDFTILPAGMWIDENVKTMDGNLSHFMKTHNVTITKLTGKNLAMNLRKMYWKVMVLF